MADVENWITFASRGIAPAPLRAKLLEDASRHLDEKTVRYVLVSLDGDTHGSNGNDHRDYEFRGRSRAEAVVALFDYLNERFPSPTGHDKYEELADDPSDERDWRRYFAPNDPPGMWLMELREEREVRTVPLEDQVPQRLATKAARPE